MYRITEHDTLDGLIVDLRHIAVEGTRELSKVVRKNVNEGNKIGKGFAKESAGAHGKLYPRAWSAEMTGALEGEYGPESAMPQGGMSFERGSRNQPAHLDAARSADIIGPKFARDVSKVADELFWPGAG